MQIFLRLLTVIVGLAGWFFTQSLIASRPFPENGIGDGIFDLTSGIHHYLFTNVEAANLLLIVSSLVIDVLGAFLLLSSIFGSTVRPFIGLLIVFALRQICQALCALPAPEGMIWRDPGFPNFLVTYGTASDFFFSGHTSIAVVGAVELARLGRPSLKLLGFFIAIFEATTVLFLRAHYTMDVFTGVITALWATGVAAYIAPKIDAFLARLGKGGAESVRA